VVALRLEEAPSREHEERHRPQRVDVGPRVGVGGVPQALGGHVERRAQHARELRDVARVHVLELLHQPEVEHLDHVEFPAVAAEHQVVGLHVAMHQAVVVRLLERAANLPQHVDGARNRHPPLLLHELLQRQAV
jgi:hypothetical protein